MAAIDLSTIFDRVRAPIAADATCVAIPLIDQLDREHDAKIKRALGGAEVTAGGLVGKGVCFSLYALGGFPKDGNDNQELRLGNELLLVVEENTAEGKNTSGESGYEWMHRLLRLIHGLGSGSRNRATVRFSTRGPAWDFGPMGEGLAVYFINLVVDSAEPAGPLPPP
jgi:hypothetical protein